MKAVQKILNLGVREFVVCAGARNMPLVEALCECEDVYLWNHFEERSSGFFHWGGRCCQVDLAQW